MYFSGHMIDNYSKHLSSLSVDRISDLVEALSDDAQTDESSKYRDRAPASIAGIITARRTKLVKNGDTMAFLTVEDRYGEIEVIVFARQYKQYADTLAADAAVYIKGTLSTEEGEAPKLLLSEAESLVDNQEYSVSSPGTVKREVAERRVFIKVQSLADKRIDLIYRIATLNAGRSPVVLYDESTKKYSAIKGVSLDPSDKVIARLSSIFSPQSVVVK